MFDITSDSALGAPVSGRNCKTKLNKVSTQVSREKITQRQSNKTKQKFCRGRSLLGQVLPTMVYGLRKEEARAAAILCPLLAALLSLYNTT